MNILVIAEKPSVALRIAIALGDNSQKRLNLGGVGYFEIPKGGDTIYVAPAVGHVFTVAQADATRGYPVMNIKWVASYEAHTTSDYTKKYLDVFRALAPKCDVLVNACDFDTEGTVIGTNIIRFTSDVKKAKRMKFSTTTIPELREAFSNLMPFDEGNFNAGEARHMLDWLWGINLSRALSSAIAGTRFARPLSIGRVQGPTLALLATRDIAISKFVPSPFWKINATIKDTEFNNSRGDITDRKVADSALEATLRAKDTAVVDAVEETEQLLRPPAPFDLTTLQLEASRTLRLDPSVTLKLAQSLYEKSYISYPRTASQKLPPTLGLPRIIGELAKNPRYEKIAKRLIDEKRFRPNEGPKYDEAHPAIYPTGTMPKALTGMEDSLYNLIAKRFLSCFAPYAKVLRMRVTVNAGSENYSAKGTRMLERGWMDFYEFSTTSEKILPEFTKGESVKISKAFMLDLKTQPPKRYSKATLIAELEKRNLGTKATRAAVIDTLFKRNYLEGAPIKVTSFGLSVFGALKDNASMIVEEETTRKLEADMELIQKGEKSEAEVMEEGKAMLLEALKTFDASKAKIGEEMQKGLVESEKVIGKCVKDGGNLVMRRSGAGKQFIACSGYPDCTVTYSVPQNALIVPTGETCEHCKTPIVKVIRRGKGVFTMDLDPNCVTKQKWRERREAKAAMLPPAAASGAVNPQAAVRRATAVQKKAGAAVPGAAAAPQQAASPRPSLTQVQRDAAAQKPKIRKKKPGQARPKAAKPAKGARKTRKKAAQNGPA